MSGPSTMFDADECQALLDVIEKAGKYFQESACFIDQECHWTEEEWAAYRKLQEAGKFYVAG